MFEVGDYIVYSSKGVCKVEDIGTIDMDGISKERLYYTLTPVYDKGGHVFTPVDNNKVVRRPVISREEAEELIEGIEEIEALGIKDDRKREAEYKEALKKCDTKEWIRILKMLYARRDKRIAEGKKMTSSDEKYLNLAKESLDGELAIALKISREEVDEYIESRTRNVPALMSR